MINKKIITKILCCLILLLASLIFIKKSESNKEKFYSVFYESSFSFNGFDKFYKKYFGDVLPNDRLSILSVSNEQVYNEYESYLDGQKFMVKVNTPIPVIQSGLIVYKGEKDGYGFTVIIQGVDGIDYWYGNIINTDVNLYEYVNKNSIIGECANDYFYLVLKNKSGFIPYETYKS